jgi:hypothetical protein
MNQSLVISPAILPQPFTPPFCPNPWCPFHTVDPGDFHWFAHFGSHHTHAFGPVPRFICRFCGRSFSTQTFRLDYYVKRPLPYSAIMYFLTNAMSIRAISRGFGVKCDAILNRIDRLGRQCLAAHSSLSDRLPLSEDLASDGFQSFDVSKYFPNNIHILVGSSSQFLYAFSHVTLRRSGHMTEYQKAHRARLDSLVSYESHGIERSFTDILDDLDSRWNRKVMTRLTLNTDQKREYNRAIEHHPNLARDLEVGKLTHVQVSSKDARTRENPLFPVNYFDRELRKDLAMYRRGTVCYSRNVSNGMMRLSVYSFFHNYLKPYRIVDQKEQVKTHGGMMGIETEAIGRVLESLFEYRQFRSKVEVTGLVEKVWAKALKTPLKQDPDYVPKYSVRMGMCFP